MVHDTQPRSLSNSLLSALLVALLLLLTFLLGCFKQKDADIWWHLKTGQEIVERGERPQKDWYTFTSSDRDWIDLHWLFQIAAARLYAVGGMELLTAASATLGAAAVGLQLLARRPSWSVPATLACWYPFLFLLAGRLYVRPEVVTLVCMSFFLTIFFHADRHPRWLWTLVPVQILWVNVQGLFILGLVLAGIYWVDGVWQYSLNKSAGRVWTRSLLLIALVGACLFNPYGLRGLLFPIELFRKMTIDADFYSKHIGELQSIAQFIRQAGYRQFYILLQFSLLSLALMSFILAWSSGRFDLFRLLTFAIFAWLGIQATRNSGQFALVAGAVTAWNFGEWLDARREKRAAQSMIGSTSRRPEPIEVEKRANACDQPTRTHRLSGVAIYVLLSIILCGTGWMVVSGRFYTLAGEGRMFGLGEHPFWHAHDAARFAAQPGMPARLIAFHLGHAAVFEFHKRDDQRTYCDPRLEVMSRDLLAEYHEIEHAIRKNRSDWRRMLARHDLRLLLVDHRGDHGVEATLLTDPGWRCVFFDAVASVFLQSPIADSLQIPAVSFSARHFETARLTSEFPPLEPTERRYFGSGGILDTKVPSDSQEDWVAAEGLFNIARGLRERPMTYGPLARSLALVAFDHARVGAARFPTSITGWRLMGLSMLLLSGDEIPVDDAIGTTAVQWDPTTMLDLARARTYLNQAFALDPTDFPTLTALFGITGVQKDRTAQHEYGMRLLNRTSETPQERLFQQTVRQQLDSLAQHINFNQLTGGAPASRAGNADELQVRIGDYLSSGRMDLAINEFADFVRTHGPLPWPLADCYAGLLMRSGLPHRAYKVWQEQATGSIDEGRRSERVASCHLALGAYRQATEHYRAALSISPTLVEARWGLAHCYLETGNAADLKHEHSMALALEELSSAVRSDFEWMGSLVDGLLKQEK
jgi:hypothetical protein